MFDLEIPYLDDKATNSRLRGFVNLFIPLWKNDKNG